MSPVVKTGGSPECKNGVKTGADIHEYLQTEAKRFDMGPGEFMATILQIHQFKDRDRQLILLAVDVAASTKGKRSRATRRESPR